MHLFIATVRMTSRGAEVSAGVFRVDIWTWSTAITADLLVKLRSVFRAEWSALEWRKGIQCQYWAEVPKQWAYRALTVSEPTVWIKLNTKYHPRPPFMGGPGSSAGIATRYGLDGLGIESRWEARFSAPVQTGPGAHPASCTMGNGSFPGVKSGRGVTLTPHPLLVPFVMKE